MIYQFKQYEPTEIMRNHLNMGGANPDGERIDVTNLYFERGGKPWIAVMGEYHFSRAAREDWNRELCKMKAGGITTIATYLFWIYHEETEGEFDFLGDRDIRAFVEECKKVGLDVVIRVGPWAHGECRNGGFPEWLLQKSYELRDNNAEYMSKARIWFEKIYEQVKGLFYKDGGNIIAMQLENELVDRADHLEALKKMAVEIGFEVPIYTVTGWNSAAGAEIPVDEVVPVFGGYVELPWDKSLEKLPPSNHYFFNRMRNDSAIGTDLIVQMIDNGDGWQLPYERYPFATCELGGGVQITHHRRGIIHGMDIYALSLIKLGSGNNLVGYYMYHGGTNKIGKFTTLNETKATGYPNDYPILSYDFQAPISEYGEIREQYRLLNILHLFVNDFSETLAPMEAVDAEKFVPRNDVSALRYGMRTDGKSGYVFVNHYQRLDKLENVHDVEIDTGIVRFPKINVCGDICFFMPFNMKLGAQVLEYATAQPLCRMGDTYFFMEIEGIDPEYKFAGQTEVLKGTNVLKTGDIMSEGLQVGDIRIVTLTMEQARYTRKLDGKLYIGKACDLYETDGKIYSVIGGEFAYYEWNGKEFAEKFKEKCATENVGTGNRMTTTEVVSVPCEEPYEPPYAEELNLECDRRRSWQRLSVNQPDGMVELTYVGDVAQIYADKQLVADEYYKGTAWRVPAKLLYGKECYLVVSELKDDFYRE